MKFSEPISAVAPGLHGRVLSVLARTDKALTGRAIASLVRPMASHRGTQRVLDDLVHNGLAKAEPAGRAKLYTLNRRHLAAPAVETLVNLRDEFRARMATAVDSWRTPADAVWLFGSAARGDAGPDSDVDVFVLRPDGVGDSDEGWHDQLDALADDITGWTGNHCEILELSRSELAELTAPDERLVAELRQDAVIVSGAPPRKLLGRVAKKR